MENASKALLMAASVLLGLLLLSVMIYVFRQGSRVQQTYDQKQITNQLELYNSKFEIYDRENNNIMDVISLCNLAFDINKDSNFDSSSTVQIEIATTAGGSAKFELTNTDFIKERNKIKKAGSSEPYDIYNLAVEKLNTLGIASIPQKHTLRTYLPSKNIDIDLNNDTFSMTKLKDGKTIYKYLFMVYSENDFEYHLENMKVSRIKLTAYVNPDWE